MNQRPDLNPMLELLKTRRSAPVLTLREPGPDDDQLATLLQIAARTPDHGKLAPWRFIVFAGEARQRASALIAARFKALNPEASEQQVAVESKRLNHAPTVVAVVSSAAPHAKIPEWEQQMSVGAVCMNLVTAANAMGYRTVWLTQWYAYDRDVLTGFGLAPHERIAGFIHIGSKDGPVEDRPRPALADIVTRF